MAGARGVVEVEWGGTVRRLRLSVGAIDRIETHADKGLMEILLPWNEGREKIRIGTLGLLFVEMCKAGGTPLTGDEVDALMPPDLTELAPKIMEALVAGGAMDSPASGNGEDPEKKKTPPGPPPESPGADGSN